MSQFAYHVGIVCGAMEERIVEDASHLDCIYLVKIIITMLSSTKFPVPSDCGGNSIPDSQGYQCYTEGIQASLYIHAIKRFSHTDDNLP